MKKLVIGIIVAIVILAGLLFIGGAPNEKQTQWEYLIVTTKVTFTSAPWLTKDARKDIRAKIPQIAEDKSSKFADSTTSGNLDIFGINGWELISVIGAIGGDQIWYFKRPK